MKSRTSNNQRQSQKSSPKSPEISITMTPEEEKAYQEVLNFQTKKLDRNFYLNRNLIVRSYLESMMIRRKTFCDENVNNIPEPVKDNIYKLYLLGVLPMRLGGIKINNQTF
jgi:hypothetical protein